MTKIVFLQSQDLFLDLYKLRLRFIADPFMSRFPSLDAKKIIRALKKAGFVEDRQKGSHLILINHVIGVRTVVPVHRGRTIKRSLLYAIIDDARMTPDDFLKLLRL